MVARVEERENNNHGITKISLNYNKDIYHTLDGRFLEIGGYTEENQTTVEFNDISAGYYREMDEEEVEEYGLDFPSQPVYSWNVNGTISDIPNEGTASITIGNQSFTSDFIALTSPVNIGDYAYYNQNHTIGFIVFKIQQGGMNSGGVILCSTLDFSEEEILITLTGASTSISPIEYKYLPYVADSGAYAEAFNRYSTATGEDSHAECQGTATGDSSHAEGYARASGKYAHAEGSWTVAQGDSSHAGGYETTAGHDYQTVIGKYNNNKSDTLFEIGNGYYNSNPWKLISSNAMEVTEDGTVYASDFKSKNLLPNLVVSQTINDLVVTRNSDGSITINGTASANTFLTVCSDYNYDTTKTYTLSGCPSGGEYTNAYSLYSDIGANQKVKDEGSGITFIPETSSGSIFIVIRSGQTLDNLVFKPQLEFSSNASAYTGYKNFGIDIRTVTYSLAGKTVAANTGLELASVPDIGKTYIGAIIKNGKSIAGGVSQIVDKGSNKIYLVCSTAQTFGSGAEITITYLYI